MRRSPFLFPLIPPKPLWPGVPFSLAPPLSMTSRLLRGDPLDGGIGVGNRCRDRADAYARNAAHDAEVGSLPERRGGSVLLSSARAQAAMDQGIRRSQIILDPGFGFGKLQEHNLRLLADFARLKDLGYPMLAGLSRKQFIGALVQQPVQERGYGTAGAVAVAVLKGVAYYSCA